MTDNQNQTAQGPVAESGKKDAVAVSSPPLVSSSRRRRFGRRASDIEAGPPIWLVTFTDVMGLMLTFFVMLFAMSEPAKEQWADISSALGNELGKFYGGSANNGPTDAINLNRIDFDQALDIRYLSALFESTLADNERLSDVRMIPQPGQLILSLPQDLLFETGNATVKPEGTRALYALGGVLSRIRNKIEITGYADPQPFDQEGEAYGSNWALSLARAANVAGILNKVGYERSIDIRGLSNGRYHDLADFIPDEKMRADLSRRVDVVIMDHDGRRKQQFFDLGLP